MMRNFSLVRLGFAFGAVAVAGLGSARMAAFVVDGGLVVADGRTSIAVDTGGGAAREAARGEDAALKSAKVSKYWGALDDGRLLVTLEHDHDHETPAAKTADTVAAGELSPDEVPATEDTCSTATPGEAAFLIRSDGGQRVAVSNDVLRAYPAPVGNRIAIVSAGRDLLLWDNGELTTVTAPGRVSNVGWSPDGQRLVASVYPPDWSEGAVSSALTTAEFLRLQNADLYLYDVAQGKFVSQLTDDPGTEYGAFFSEDGGALYFIWLQAMEDRGGLMRMALDLDGGTSASAPGVQLTQAGEDAGETPLGRVGTYVWMRGSSELVFEAGRPDGSGVIWAMTSSGKAARAVANGRKPQPVSDGEIMFQDSQGGVQSASPEVKP